MKQAITAAKIKKDLMEQLAIKELDKQSYYASLVDDYISLWKVKNELLVDIKKRGVSIPYDNGGGQKGWKKNDSVGELTKINKQMLNLLAELGLRAANIEAKEEVVEL